MMDDIAESISHVNLVDDELAKPITSDALQLIDTDEVNKEYEEMMKEVQREEEENHNKSVHKVQNNQQIKNAVITDTDNDKLLAEFHALPTPPQTQKPTKSTSIARNLPATTS